MNGTKTYLVAAAMIAYGVAGYLLGYHTEDTLVQIVLTGLGLAGLRHGVTTEVSK